jgi:hypothetical protein
MQQDDPMIEIDLERALLVSGAMAFGFVVGLLLLLCAGADFPEKNTYACTISCDGARSLRTFDEGTRYCFCRQPEPLP